MALLTLVNPRKRRRRNKTRSNPRKRRRHHKAKRNPIFNLTGRKTRRRHRKARHARRGFRRNPISMRGTVGSFKSAVPAIVKPAMLAAVGALSLDMLWGYLPIPVYVKTGAYSHFAKAAGAVALGVIGSKVFGRDTAMKFATGAMTVVLYGVLRDFMVKQFPSVQLGYVGSGQLAGMSMYDQLNMTAAPMVPAMMGSPSFDEEAGLSMYTG